MAINSMVSRWIPQLDDWDQSSAFFAYQSLEQETFHASRPDATEEKEELAQALAAALVEDKDGKPRYSARARGQLARLLGYIPAETTVHQLDQMLDDLEVREMARYALETNPSHRATAALVRALGLPGLTFRIGVVNSLGRQKCAASFAALRKVASDPQLEVRTAALLALSQFDEPGVREVLEEAARSSFPEERRVAGIALQRAGL